MASPPSAERSDATDDGRLRALVTGAVGGFLATVTMTVYRLPIARSLPPTGPFWAQYGPGDQEGPGTAVPLLLHLAYGVGAGAAFAALFARAAPDAAADARRESRGLALAVPYGLVLSLFGSRVLLRRMLDIELETDEALVFHVGHVVYALTLGSWVGSRME